MAQPSLTELHLYNARRRLSVLTSREREVVVHVGHGLRNADIAKHMEISEAAVKGHVGRVLAKLECANRVQIALLAFRSGMVD